MLQYVKFITIWEHEKFRIDGSYPCVATCKIDKHERKYVVLFKKKKIVATCKIYKHMKICVVLFRIKKQETILDRWFLPLCCDMPN